MADSQTTLARDFQSSLEALTAQNPHADDPRLMQINQFNNCVLRYSMFCRCARELGEEHNRCKFQYYRAQVTCTAEQLEDWDKQRQKGCCVLDVPPDRSFLHMRQ